MKIFIHAGTFKTGSSGLQNTLYYQRDKLLQNGVLYPLTGMSEHGDSIGYRHSRFVHEYNKDSYPTLINELRHEIDSHKPEILIMSSEAWSIPEGAKSLFDLIEKLQTYSNEKITLYFVVRNVYDYAVSHYREFVRRWGWSLEFNDYLKRRKSYFDYNQLFKPFIEKNLKVLFLPYSTTVNEVIIRDLGLHHLFDSDSQLRKNTSLTAPDIEICRRFNILDSKIDQKSIPKFSQISADLGLDISEAKFIENPPYREFIANFNSEYKKSFESITGLDGNLLDYSQSIFGNPNAISLNKIKPIIDIYFSENLKRLLLDELTLYDNKALSQHLAIIQKFNWVGDVSTLPTNDALSLKQAYWQTLPLGKAFASIIKKLMKSWIKKVQIRLRFSKD